MTQLWDGLYDHISHLSKDIFPFEQPKSVFQEQWKTPLFARTNDNWKSKIKKRNCEIKLWFAGYSINLAHVSRVSKISWKWNIMWDGGECSIVHTSCINCPWVFLFSMAKKVNEKNHSVLRSVLQVVKFYTVVNWERILNCASINSTWLKWCWKTHWHSNKNAPDGLLASQR